MNSTTAIQDWLKRWTMHKPKVIIPMPTSFDEEYNARCWQQYAAACERFGAEAVALPLQLDQSAQAKIVATGNAVLLPGSPADVNPEKYGEPRQPRCSRSDGFREAADELLLQDAFNLGKPVLGVCYGMQSLNVWRGGALIQHLETATNHTPGREVKHAHALVVEEGSRLSAIVSSAAEDGTPQVNSSHHQAVGRAGDGLRVTATSAGDGTIEAVEGEGQFLLGVQWHPERTLSSSALSARVFEEFVEAARNWEPTAVNTSIG
jgi:putative glutamine amidotransferase